jgi:trigger factor
VVDFVLELARVTDSTVTAEELARDPDAPPDAPVAPDQVAAVPAIPEQPVPEQAVHEQAIVGQSAEEP